MKKFFAMLPILALAACGGSATSDTGATYALKDVLMSTDVDGMVGWISDPNALVKGPAHSGSYSLRVDETHEFSPGFNAVLGQLCPTRPRGVRLEAWEYAASKNSKAKLEFVVRESATGKELMREQLHLEDAREYGKWTPISKEIIFPPTITYTSQLVIYMSRAEATEPVYVDDIKLIALH